MSKELEGFISSLVFSKMASIAMEYKQSGSVDLYKHLPTKNETLALASIVHDEISRYLRKKSAMNYEEVQRWR